MNSFLSVFCIHSQPGWDGRAESVIPRDSTDCAEGQKLKGKSDDGTAAEVEVELKMRPQGIVRWVNITMSRECRDESNHHGNQVKVKVDIVMESESGKVNVTING